MKHQHHGNCKMQKRPAATVIPVLRAEMPLALQARLGGEPTRTAQIQAFLRLRMADAGPLDFDSQGGVGTDTTWPTIFYCLRCGYHSEALQVSPKAAWLSRGLETLPDIQHTPRNNPSLHALLPISCFGLPTLLGLCAVAHYQVPFSHSWFCSS